MDVTALIAETVPITEKVAYLSSMPGVDRVIETHMAFVFLTAEFVLKLKKPVSFGYFDHRTLAARTRACKEEVRLNRALAGDIYLGIVPLLQTQTGLALKGDGVVVDWLVRMRRLPADRMLDELLANRSIELSDARVTALMDHLARFYREQQRSRPPAGVYVEHLLCEQAVNTENLNRMAQYLPGIPLASLTTGLERLIERMSPEIRKREAAALVIEGHGDLRPEHVCFSNPPVIFDRVETALELRVIDVFDEVGYLAAECKILGLPELGQRLLTELANAGFAPPSPELQSTYATFRLVTRARLALDHLADPSPRTPEKWPLRAKAYLAEALNS